MKRVNTCGVGTLYFFLFQYKLTEKFQLNSSKIFITVIFPHSLQKCPKFLKCCKGVKKRNKRRRMKRRVFWGNKTSFFLFKTKSKWDCIFFCSSFHIFSCPTKKGSSPYFEVLLSTKKNTPRKKCNRKQRYFHYLS